MKGFLTFKSNCIFIFYCSSENTILAVDTFDLIKSKFSFVTYPAIMLSDGSTNRSLDFCGYIRLVVPLGPNKIKYLVIFFILTV